jgi:Fur family transcriptional regulator, ferric uptake regulator
MELQETLRAKGYRLTPQRQLVLDAVTDLGHATPDEACAWVKERSSAVNISTIYRTLELLEELGLVTHTHLGHGAPTYHASGAIDHLHLVCRVCGAIIETDVALADSLVGMLTERHGFETDVAHFAIYGRCQGCTP